MKNDPLKPTVTLLIKLGSAMVHMEEMLETKFKNIEYDLPAFKTVADDNEVHAWIKAMGPLLPLKRSTKP